MPEKEEFKTIIYNLLKHLETTKDITLLATEEVLKQELDNLYIKCENKLKGDFNGQKEF